MKRIKKEDLYPSELAILDFHLQVVPHTEEEKQFIYCNLFRDENDVAYFPSRNHKKLLAICTD
jgi:hypothetical protein